MSRHSVDAELAGELKRQFQEATRPAPTGGPDLTWARKIVERSKAQGAVTPTVLKMARDALAGRWQG